MTPTLTIQELGRAPFQGASQSRREGERTPEVRSSLEYEETDEEGSVHSFSSMLGKTRSFAEVVKSTPPSSPQHDHRIKQVCTSTLLAGLKAIN